MRYTFLFMILFLLGVNLQAQLFTPGTGIRWNIDSLVANGGLFPSSNGNYYLLGDDVTIVSGDTVEILTDDSIKVSQAKLITVEGVLLIDAPTEMVITSLNPAQKFEGFRFDGSDASSLRNTSVINAGGIKLVDSDVLFEDCHFEHFDKSNSTGTIDAYQSDPVIRGCSFVENAGPAVASGSNAASSPQIYNCYMYHNNTSNANTPQINLGISGSDTIRIVGNTIEGFYDMAGGVAISTLIGGSITARIDSNMIINNRYGIACIGSNINAVIRHNYIADNNIQNIPMQGGSGINFLGGTSNTAIVSHNEITGNLWGITLQQNAQPNLGQIEPDTTNIGWNKIYDNGNNGVVYNLYNNTPGDIKAENNYWGSYIPDTVEAGIFHQPDDGSLGFVDYLPLSPLVTGQELSKEGSSSHVLVSRIFPNPAIDRLSIQFVEALLNEDKYLYLIDISGRQVFNVRLGPGVPEYTIRTTYLNPGHYFLQVIAGKQAEVVRVFVGKGVSD